MKKIYQTFLSICLPFICLGAYYQKIVVRDNNAICLDGSPGVYYFSRGKNSSKFMIYFQGGGWCFGNSSAKIIQNCYGRSSMQLGSTKNDAQNIVFNDGILSDSPQNSFADFNKVYFRYCDGAGHQGTKSLPQVYNGSNLYFRGSNLTISKLQHLQSTLGLFSRSTQIMITGGSAGGLAALTWADYIKNRTHHSNVYCVSDSGIFIDSINIKTNQNKYKNSMIYLFQYSNAQIDPPNPQCVSAFPGQSYKCMFAQYMYPYIQTRLFIIQSLYDQWSLKQILGVFCQNKLSFQNCSAQQRSNIQEYKIKIKTVIQNIGNKVGNGYWAPVCVRHIFLQDSMFYSYFYTIPMKTNNTIDFVLANWVSNTSGTHKFMDSGMWPDNNPCSVERLKDVYLRWVLGYFCVLICLFYMASN